MENKLAILEVLKSGMHHKDLFEELTQDPHTLKFRLARSCLPVSCQH